jgi:hypothetical protein
VDKPREGEDEEDGHAEEEVRAEDRMRIGNEAGYAGLQRENSLRSGHEPHHFVSVEVVERDDDRREAEQELDMFPVRTYGTF